MSSPRPVARCHDPQRVHVLAREVAVDGEVAFEVAFAIAGVSDGDGRYRMSAHWQPIPASESASFSLYCTACRAEYITTTGQLLAAANEQTVVALEPLGVSLQRPPRVGP